MKRMICICCGEAMARVADGIARNPNVCASCDSLLDWNEDPGEIEGGSKHTPEIQRETGNLCARVWPAYIQRNNQLPRGDQARLD